MVAWRRTDFWGLRSALVVPSVGDGPEGNVRESRNRPQGRYQLSRGDPSGSFVSGATASLALRSALGSSAMKIAERPARRRDDAPPAAVEVSIVMPCLNEAATLPACIAMAREAIANGGYSAEIIVADNGSSDGSQPLARELGARVVDVQRKGYGSALIGGIDAAQGRFVVMGDADASYDFAAIAPLIARLREGYDLVVGNRF